MVNFENQIHPQKFFETKNSENKHKYEAVSILCYEA